MNQQIINLLFIWISSMLLFCQCQTIIFHKTDSLANQTSVDIIPTDFHCPVSNSTKSLHLNYTGLEKLPKNFIDSVPINCVNLQGNQLVHIHRSIFTNFPNLTFLNLANNQIYPNELLSFGPHEKLETLILDNNFEREYPLQTGLRCWDKFPNLRKLYVRNNQITFFDDDCRDNFPKLTHLYLSGNTEKTGSLQASVYNIPKKLMYLEIENNGICRFNGSNFKNLTTLLIGGNQFLRLGTSDHSYLNVKNMPRLKNLSASGCEMREINVDAFEETENLEKLNLTVNLLDNIVENTFRKFQSMKILSLSYNRFRKIPKEISLSNLRELDLNYNFINVIEMGSFTKSNLLEKLSLRGNEIQVIEKNAFANLAKLTDLDLRENEIHELYPNWANDLKILRNLNLILNQISSTEFLQLENSTVENVYLDSKNLKNITFTKLRKNLVLHFNLDDNPERSTNFRHRYSKYYQIKCKK